MPLDLTLGKSKIDETYNYIHDLIGREGINIIKSNTWPRGVDLDIEVENEETASYLLLKYGKIISS